MSHPKSCAALLIGMTSVAWAQAPQVVCDRGLGHFDATVAGVTVHVGPVKERGFATRACEATLHGANAGAVVVPSAAQVDIDVLRADLGTGVPVVAFVVRPKDGDWGQTYEVWTLARKPRKLLTLTGEEGYRASDANFNGQVALWTTDASGVEGFDGLTHDDITSPPRVALRLERSGLLDVSAWYCADYDRQIGTLRQGLPPQDLYEFRNSVRHENSVLPGAEHQPAMRKTEATVLEIVWAYLYSGRPERAWAELGKDWPPDDVARVKAALIDARSQGIESRVAKVASATQPPGWLDDVKVYEFLKADPTQQNGGRMMYGALGVSGTEGPVFVKDATPTGLYAADQEPKPILLWRPPPAAEQPAQPSANTLLLTIDEAGKVKAATMLTKRSDPDLLEAAKSWKFIPAYAEGKPVAYRLKMDVNVMQ